MADKYRPTMVIGLGGTGKKIIVALKKMIAENSQYGMADFPFLKLLSIDTDDATPNATSAIKTIKGSELALDANKEVYSLRCGFANAPDLTDYPEIKEWFPESFKTLLPRIDAGTGANQKKPVGRFTFAWNAKEIYNKIQPFLNAPVDIDAVKQRGLSKSNYDEKNLNVFICGSVCGGTGAGTFLDTANLVRHISKELSGRTINIYGIIGLASLFDKSNGTMLEPNCYASLMELDHFMNEINYTNPFRMFRAAYKNYNPTYKPDFPFDFPLIFDNTNSNGYAFPSSDAFAEMSARFIYLLTGHQVSDNWNADFNNYLTQITDRYNNYYNKPNRYGSMGTFSIMYPKRLIVQLCAYRLSKEYLNIILDDSYAPQEISNLSKNFLDEIKLNPNSESLQRAFENYHDGDFTGDFSEFIDMHISDFDDIDKKEIVQRLRGLKTDLDQVLQKYKQLNCTKARDIRKSFLIRLDERLKFLLNLRVQDDYANKTPDGQPKQIRGSIVRTEKFVDDLLGISKTASEKYRKKANESAALISNSNNDFELAMSNLDEVVDGFNPSKKKLKEAKEQVYDSLRTLFVAKKEELVSNWIRELFDNILENGIPKYTGLVEELQKYKDGYLKTIDLFKELNKEIEKFIDDNKQFKDGHLCEILFNYEKDVEETYAKLIAEKGKNGADIVFGEISDELSKEENFGSVYERTSILSMTAINLKILSATEHFFFEPINKVLISERIFEDKNVEILRNLENGTYVNAAGIFLQLDQAELSKENVSFDASTFFAMTIPDEYSGKECSGNTDKQCPMDANPEKFKGKECPKYKSGRCLKRLILKSAPETLTIIPTAEISEINIIKTIVGCPLHACSSVMNNCKPEYEAIKAKFAADDKAKNIEQERINMFGTIKLDALDEKTIDPKTQLVDFRKKIILGVIANRLMVQALSIDFITEEDMKLGRKDKPSLHFGKNIDAAMEKFQSTKISDVKEINRFITEIGLLTDDIRNDSSAKEQFVKLAKEKFENWSKSLPAGFKDSDITLMNELVKELTGIELISEVKLTSRFG